jgi:hypothetical protein
LDAIRSTPRVDVENVLTDAPWEVIVPCPGADAFGAHHRALFTGLAGREPEVLFGTPASGVDVATEVAAADDFYPAAELARVEHGATMLVAAELLITAAVLVAAWLSGALGAAVRENSAWLGVCLILAASAAAFGAIPLFVTHDPEANVNDVLDLRRSYANRISLLHWTSAISAILFGLALIAGVATAADAAPEPTSATSVAFDTTRDPVIGNVTVSVTDAATSDPVLVDVRTFDTATGVGTRVARLTGTADTDGSAQLAQAVAMGGGAQFVTVAVGIGTGETPVCTPTVADTPGCTVVTIPAPDPGVTPSATSQSAASASVTFPVVENPSASPTLAP